MDYFGRIGYISNPNKNLTREFRVTKIDHIVNYIIPFFDKCNIKGSKYDFKSAVLIIKNKEHLKQDGLGLKKILLLKKK